LRKAFDTVDTNILLAKLNHYGIRGTCLSYISSYLTNRKQYVSVNNAISATHPINYGVPQGSILGPVLFLIYINDLPRSLTVKDPISFADDTTLTYLNKNILDLTSNINSDLSKLNDWLAANKLTMNVQKTNYIFFQRQNTSLPPLELVVNNVPIRQAHDLRILGVTFDQNLSFKIHTNNIKNKLVSSLFVLRRIRTNISVSNACLLYNSLIKSHLSYCITIWGNSNSQNINALYVIQNKYLKSAFLLPMRTASISLYKRANVLTVFDLYNYHIAILVYKLLNSPEKLPPSILPLLNTINQIHNYSTRASTSSHLFTHAYQTKTRQLSLATQAPSIWNAIPTDIKLSPSIPIFKHKYHTYLIDSM
jgi:hypothetical protein